MEEPRRASRLSASCECPVCGQSFPPSQIVAHADACARRLEESLGAGSANAMGGGARAKTKAKKRSRSKGRKQKKHPESLVLRHAPASASRSHRPQSKSRQSKSSSSKRGTDASFGGAIKYQQRHGSGGGTTAAVNAAGLQRPRIVQFKMLKEEIVKVDNVPIRAKLLTHSRRMREAVRLADNKQLRVSHDSLSSSMSLLTKAKVAQALARRSEVGSSDHRPRQSAGMQRALLNQAQGLQYPVETAGTHLPARSQANTTGGQSQAGEEITFTSTQGHGQGQGGSASAQQRQAQEHNRQGGKTQNQALATKCPTEAERDAKAKALEAAEEEKAAVKAHAEHQAREHAFSQQRAALVQQFELRRQQLQQTQQQQLQQVQYNAGVAENELQMQMTHQQQQLPQQLQEQNSQLFLQQLAHLRHQQHRRVQELLEEHQLEMYQLLEQTQAQAHQHQKEYAQAQSKACEKLKQEKAERAKRRLLARADARRHVVDLLEEQDKVAITAPGSLLDQPQVSTVTAANNIASVGCADTKRKQNNTQTPTAACAPASNTDNRVDASNVGDDSTCTNVQKRRDEQVKREVGSMRTSDGEDKSTEVGKEVSGNNNAQGDQTNGHEEQKKAATESCAFTTGADVSSSGTTTALPTKMDAQKFVDELKKRVGASSETYRAFIQVLSRYHDHKIKTEPVMRRVASLLCGHSDLIIGFETFLPKGKSMARFVTGNSALTPSPVPSDSALRKLSPSEQLGDANASAKVQATCRSSKTDADATNEKCHSKGMTDAGAAPPTQALTSQPEDASSSPRETLSHIKTEPDIEAKPRDKYTGLDGSKSKSPASSCAPDASSVSSAGAAAAEVSVGVSAVVPKPDDAIDAAAAKLAANAAKRAAKAQIDVCGGTWFGDDVCARTQGGTAMGSTQLLSLRAAVSVHDAVHMDGSRRRAARDFSNAESVDAKVQGMKRKRGDDAGDHAHDDGNVRCEAEDSQAGSAGNEAKLRRRAVVALRKARDHLEQGFEDGVQSHRFRHLLSVLLAIDSGTMAPPSLTSHSAADGHREIVEDASKVRARVVQETRQTIRHMLHDFQHVADDLCELLPS